jgi:hypothetical protein
MISVLWFVYCTVTTGRPDKVILLVMRQSGLELRDLIELILARKSLTPRASGVHGEKRTAMLATRDRDISSQKEAEHGMISLGFLRRKLFHTQLLIRMCPPGSLVGALMLDFDTTDQYHYVVIYPTCTPPPARAGRPRTVSLNVGQPRCLSSAYMSSRTRVSRLHILVGTSPVIDEESVSVCTVQFSRIGDLGGLFHPFL